MGTWNEFLQKEGTPPEWPYPVKFGEETEYDVDVVVLGRMLGSNHRSTERRKSCYYG